MTLRIILFAELLIMVLIRRVFQIVSARAKTDTIHDVKSTLQIQTALSVLAIVATALVALSPTLLAWAALPFPAWLRWTGAVVGALGDGLLLWSHYALGCNFFGGLSLKRQHTLVQTGPYRWVRHPMYSALLFISVGFFLLSANGLVGALWIVLMVQSIGTRVAREERMMQEAFGDAYARYMENTGRFFPKLGV